MAEEAMGLYLDSLQEDKEPYPKSSAPDDIETEGRDFVSLVDYNEAAQGESLLDSIQNIENGIGISRKYTDVQNLYTDLGI